MSPEQCEGETQIDGRSDLYSLGCVLHELLTGRPPFPRGKAREIMNQHMNTPPASLRTLRPDIPDELDTIVLTMLAKKPDDRPDDADGLAAILLAALRPGAPAAGQARVQPSRRARLPPPRRERHHQGSPSSATGTQGSTGGSTAA